MLPSAYRPGRKGVLLCTFCGREIARGQEYWAVNGEIACAGCLLPLARRELAPCWEIRGREERG